MAENARTLLRQVWLYRAKKDDSRNQPKTFRQILSPETGVRIPVAALTVCGGIARLDLIEGTGGIWRRRWGWPRKSRGSEISRGVNRLATLLMRDGFPAGLARFFGLLGTRTVDGH
jgi:hypothetical protein